MYVDLRGPFAESFLCIKDLVLELLVVDRSIGCGSGVLGGGPSAPLGECLLYSSMAEVTYGIGWVRDCSCVFIQDILELAEGGVCRTFSIWGDLGMSSDFVLNKAIMLSMFVGVNMFLSVVDAF